MALRITPTLVDLRDRRRRHRRPARAAARRRRRHAVAGAAVTVPAVRPRRSTSQIADFSFGQPRTVAAGAVVQVSNADAEAHTLTAEDGTFDTGSVDGGTVVSFTAPTVPGTYSFYCDIHPSMTGSLVVG